MAGVVAAVAAALAAAAVGPRARGFESHPDGVPGSTAGGRTRARAAPVAARPAEPQGQVAVRRFQPPAPQPLSHRDLLAKAGDKEGDTTYTRLLEEVLDQMPGLDESIKDELRYIARKRQGQLKSKMLEQPGLGEQRGAPEEDELAAVERRLLGEPRYRLYRARMAETFQQ